MAKKKLDFSFSSPSYRALKSKVSKNDAKVPHFEADLRVGSRAGGKLFCLSVRPRNSREFLFPKLTCIIASQAPFSESGFNLKMIMLYF